eukprot:gnl/Hemi2/16516_TR5522_c0_g1_i1.p1 gnl/Hemi2/16516_TR5522_c0_g1~~gnl/Hemi2/16516_TR5522_c0_g1_i1.p1  ORF type:complete len:243 (+),score=55.73 gnl/Hemi2/16516_TR5522_c0_g1_i1:74-730(+)
MSVPSTMDCYMDPISLEIMESCVMTTCGHSFSESTIDKWLTTHTTCPLCKAAVDKAALRPNFALRQAIALYKSQRTKADETDILKKFSRDKDELREASLMLVVKQTALEQSLARGVAIAQQKQPVETELAKMRSAVKEAAAVLQEVKKNFDLMVEKCHSAEVVLAQLDSDAATVAARGQILQADIAETEKRINILTTSVDQARAALLQTLKLDQSEAA